MFFQKLGSLFATPLLGLVVPGDRSFSWNQREGWQRALSGAGIPFRSCYQETPVSRELVERIFKFPVVLFLNDHHLEPLLSALARHPAGELRRSRQIRILVSTERVIGSPFPGSEEKTRQGASLCQFTALFDRGAMSLVKATGSVPIFIHQYVDHRTFVSRIPYVRKKSSVFWTGKLPGGHVQGEYSSRTRLFEALRGLPGFVWREAYKPDLSITQAVRERDSHQGLLHLPSNCPGYTSTFFENLAMGGCVLQYGVGVEYALPDLKAGQHYLAYDADRPETLLTAAETFLKNPALYRDMAQEGQTLCLQHHTIQQRLKEIFHRVTAGLGQNGVPRPDSEAGYAVREILGRLDPQPVD